MASQAVIARKPLLLGMPPIVYYDNYNLLLQLNGGAWGAICGLSSEGWNQNSIRVLCRTLGNNAGGQDRTGTSSWMSGSRAVSYAVFLMSYMVVTAAG